jgi:hypothetical protein
MCEQRGPSDLLATSKHSFRCVAFEMPQEAAQLQTRVMDINSDYLVIK